MVLYMVHIIVIQVQHLFYGINPCLQWVLGKTEFIP